MPERDEEDLFGCTGCMSGPAGVVVLLVMLLPVIARLVG